MTSRQRIVHHYNFGSMVHEHKMNYNHPPANKSKQKLLPSGYMSTLNGNIIRLDMKLCA